MRTLGETAVIDDPSPAPVSPGVRGLRAPRLGRVLARLPLAQLPGIAVAIVTWELVSRSGLVPSRYVPPFSQVFPQLLTEMQAGRFWAATGSTLNSWAFGLAIALAVGVPFGALIGSNRYAYRATRFVLEFLRPIPAVALIPLAILVLGITNEMKIFLVAFATVWPITIQTVYGVRELDSVARDTARSFGFSRRDVFIHVTMPTAAPSIATGIRLASALAIVIAVTAELVAGAPGLGSEILVAQSSGSSVRLYALILATGLLSYALTAALEAVERRVLRWHTSYRGDGS